MTNQKTEIKPWARNSDCLSSFEWDGVSPLKILFCTWGSRGDIQPNIALGLELVRRGHKVTIMGLAKYRSIVECHPGLTFLAYVDSNIFEMSARCLEPNANVVKLSAEFASQSFEELTSQYLEASKDADILFGCSMPALNLTMYTTAQAAKKPFFLLTHDPFNVMPNSEWSFDPGSNHVGDYGRFRNLLNTSAMPFAVGFYNTILPWSNVRRYRKELGLSTPWPYLRALNPSVQAEIPTFCTWDQSLWSLPTSLSEHWHGVGFLETQSSTTKVQEQEHEVLSWINNRKDTGRGLIYAGCGSFDHHDRAFFTKALVHACKELELDMITLPSTIDENEPLPDFVYVAKSDLPHAAIFRRCDAIVHHGGAGTSHQVIRSGVPGICCPSMNFQAMWGHALQEKGAGLLLTHEELKASFEKDKRNVMKESLEVVIGNEKMRKAASELASNSKKVDGTKVVADKVFDYLSAL